MDTHSDDVTASLNTASLNTASLNTASLNVPGNGRASVGVRELRAGLSEAVRRAGAGQRTIVTSGGHPVAQLGPLDADSPDLDRLIGAGAVVAPRRRSVWRPPPPVVVWAGSRIDQVLRELRG